MQLLFLVIDLVIGVGLGYIPGVDNFGQSFINRGFPEPTDQRLKPIWGDSSWA